MRRATPCEASRPLIALADLGVLEVLREHVQDADQSGDHEQAGHH
jgi:hypothetical protein